MYTLKTKYRDIEEFVQQVDVSSYSRTRNYLDGAVTHLSAYITHGVVDQVFVLESLRKRFDWKVIKPFIFQMAWREYFYNVWASLGDDIFTDIKNVQEGVSSYGINESMVTARTGLLALDEQLKNLVETGYMHNHARMWVAGFVCNFANFYWLENAKWMYYHLLDGDLASNMLSWQWVAGTFSSKKYLFNQNNLNKYSKIHQTDTFVDKPYPNLFDEKMPDHIFKSSDSELHTEYPESTNLEGEELSDNILLYHPWMLDPTWMQNSESSRVLLIEPKVFDRFPVSAMRMEFILELAKNIPDLYVVVMNFDDFKSKFAGHSLTTQEHPIVKDWTCDHLPRRKLFPTLTGYDSSFFKFWKKAEKLIKMK